MVRYKNTSRASYVKNGVNRRKTKQYMLCAFNTVFQANTNLLFSILGFLFTNGNFTRNLFHLTVLIKSLLTNLRCPIAAFINISLRSQYTRIIYLATSAVAITLSHLPFSAGSNSYIVVYVGGREIANGKRTIN